MKPRLTLYSPKHREEAAKLSASLLNGVAVACLIGASFGPLLNAALAWGWRSAALLAAAAVFHYVAQIVLSLAFKLEQEP